MREAATLGGMPSARRRSPLEADESLTTTTLHDKPGAGDADVRSRNRLRRWIRRLALAVLVLIVAVTLAAFAYDIATSGSARPASSLYPGPFVRVDGTLLAYRSWGHAGSPVVLLGGAGEPPHGSGMT